MISASGALSMRPSFTVNCTTYRPGTSGTSEESTPVSPPRLATLPAGRDSSRHR